MSTSTPVSAATSVTSGLPETGHVDPRFHMTAPYKPPFLQSAGTPSLPWSSWLRGFEDWLLCCGVPSTLDFAPRKAAILRASLGVEGQRVYYSLAPAEPESYDDAVKRMKQHYGKTSGTIFNRSNFYRCLQRQGESLVQYLSTLRELARLCNFPDGQFDERVRDQYAMGCWNQRIRERLLQEPDETTLDSMVLLATTLERAQLEAPALAGRSRDVSVSVVGQQHSGRKQHGRPSNKSNSGWSTSSSACYRCGRTGHTSKDSSCPARNSQCHLCSKIGHYQSVCKPSRDSTSGQSASRRFRPRSRSRGPQADTKSTADTVAKSVSTVTISSVTSDSSQYNARHVTDAVVTAPVGLAAVSASNSVDIDTDAEALAPVGCSSSSDKFDQKFNALNTAISAAAAALTELQAQMTAAASASVTSSPSAAAVVSAASPVKPDAPVASVAVNDNTPGVFRHVDALIKGVPIRLLVDLGAKVSILNKSDYSRLQSSVRLFRPDTVLRAFGGTEIRCIGRIFVPIQVGDRSLPSFRFYITTDGLSVLGVDLFDAMGGQACLAGVNLTAPAHLIGFCHATPSSLSLDQFPVLTKTTPGLLKGFVHRPTIDPSVRPVRQKFWHPPLAKREPIAAELARLEQQGVIERIDASPWTSNLLTVPKRDGGLRLCVNLTDANKCIIPERYPLPTMEELTEKLAGSTIFSKIDLLWGYLQLELSEDRRNLTAFVSHVGVFRYRSTPFGIASGPSAFHQVIRTILKDLDGCTSILDDILVYGRTVEEHDRRLGLVLQKLSDVNATVRKDKCVIGAAEVEFNGHRINASGILPLRSNVDALLRIPSPTDVKQLSRFLSTATYYLKFVPDFADIADPLRKLLKANAQWTWTDNHQRRFDLLKRRVAEPPILAHFDVNFETVVTCDASAVAIGATLSQRLNGVEHPVAFASRTLSDAERRYSASEREALACMWACEHWHFYLYGRRFTLVTDHQALKTLLTTGGTGHRPLRLHRWADRLQQYSYDMEFKPGRLNVVADCLSRSYDAKPASIPSIVGPDASDDDEAESSYMIQTIFGQLATSVVTMHQVAEATAADEELLNVLNLITAGWPSSDKQLPVGSRAYFRLRDELSVAYGGRCVLRGYRVVIPASLRSQILDLAHEGHPGVVRMKSKCRETVWWPGIDADVERHVRNCEPCIVSGKSVRPTSGPLLPVALPTGPWRKLSLDIAGEFVAAPRQQRFMIVATDYFQNGQKLPAVKM